MCYQIFNQRYFSGTFCFDPGCMNTCLKIGLPALIRNKMKPVNRNKTRFMWIIFVGLILNWWQIFVTCRSNTKQHQVIPLLLLRQKEQEKFWSHFDPRLGDLNISSHWALITLHNWQVCFTCGEFSQNTAVFH